ncbi:hypothetical protein [Qipengyuania sphaerica]|uniref:hypothetical protein n=1 Tax=Qipengyuania sphaerica TaxID=2867243 RepID=UPI001C86AA8B|nr:hypothetical protein [Qipengyuania sphaerica]MBX7539836.1 hypothetical protein [Qipengyuania sphaerica]
MKFDLDTAWKDATQLLRDNFGLLAVVAGVFYFLPYFAAMLWVPGLAELTAGQFDPNSDAFEAMANELVYGYWWVMLLVAIVQGIGLLAMLALLRRRAAPTVAEAIQVGAKSVLSYLAASLLMGFAISLVIILLIAIPAALGSTTLAVLGGIVAIVIAMYLFTKFSLVGPVIGIEGMLNPVAALGRSWRLTKGNSVRLFFFYFLLFVAYLVISALVGMVFSLIFALGGTETQTFGTAFSSSLMQAVFSVVFAGVLAAVLMQLVRLHRSGDGGDLERAEP